MALIIYNIETEEIVYRAAGWYQLLLRLGVGKPSRKIFHIRTSPYDDGFEEIVWHPLKDIIEKDIRIWGAYFFYEKDKDWLKVIHCP